MPRAFDAVIPPEYKIQATQVTQHGEPVTQQITPSAYGSYGRAPQDPNDMHQQGMQAEVWKKGQSPAATTRQRVDAQVAQLKHLTRTGQINTPEVTEREGATKVVYDEVSRDDQVSNVKGMQLTGDPQTLGQALKSTGQSSFEQKTPLDAPRARSSMHRAVRSMPQEHQEAFQEVMARKGPEAFESMAPTALAGLNVENVGSTASGVPVPRVRAPRAPMLRSSKPRKRVKISPKAQTRMAKVSQALIRQRQKAEKDEGAHPAAFDQLVKHAAQRQESGASKPVAKYHPAQSNFEDVSGQTKSGKVAPRGAKGGRVAARGAAEKATILKASAAKLAKANKELDKKTTTGIKAWKLLRKKANKAQEAGATKDASKLLEKAQKLQQQVAKLKQEQNKVKQGITQAQQETVKAKASGDISSEDQQEISQQLYMPKTPTGGAETDPGFYQGGLPGMATDSGMAVVGEDGTPEQVTEEDFDFDFTADTGMKTSTKVLIGSGIAAALGLGIYAFAR